MGDADLVIAVGTELGPTDYDLNSDGGFVLPKNLVRIDIDAEQLARHPTTVAIEADCAAALDALLAALTGKTAAIRQRLGWREARAGRAKRRPRRTVARRCRRSSRPSRRSATRCPARSSSAIRRSRSMPPISIYDHDRPGGWFNAATGFGTLGYGPPAAIGAALAVPDATVVCLSGDGGFQFSLPELAAAVGSRRAGHLHRLEQFRLPRDRDLDARRRRRAGRRVAGTAGFRQDRGSLRHCG